jgi:hypothetical protein
VDFFQGEVFIGAQIVNPHLRRRRFFRCWFAVKEKDVRLHTLRVEDAGRKTQQCVNVGLLQQFTTDCFAGAAFEEDVIRNNDCGAAVLLQHAEDVLTPLAPYCVILVTNQRGNNASTRRVDAGFSNKLPILA